MAEPRQIAVTLRPDGVLAPALRAIQDTVEVVSFCLDALDRGDLSRPPEYKDTRFEFSFAGPELNAEQRKTNYTNWLLWKGFQDLARGMRQTLEEALLYNSMIELALKELPQLKTWGALQERMLDFRKKAGSARFPELMQAVNKGLTSPLHFENEFLSLQKVRNCLEHRGGVVTDKDVDDTKVLRLALPRVKMFYEKDGQEIELGKGSYVEANTAIGIKNVIEERKFKLGERVLFRPQEFHDIGFGCWAFANDLRMKLPKLETKATNA
jgi:hypothetical protein